MSRKSFDPNDLAWMEQFRTAVRLKKRPDRQALVFIANGFAKYLAGAASLDAAFELKTTQHSGPAAQRHAREEVRNRLCWEMFDYLKTHRVNRSAAAQSVVADFDSELDVDTLVRYYGKWLRSVRKSGVDDVTGDWSADWCRTK